MRASKFSDAEKAFILRQGEYLTPTAEICRRSRISQATDFSWKKKYAGLLPDDMRRLKKFAADPTLDREMLQDVISRTL